MYVYADPGLPDSSTVVELVTEVVNSSKVAYLSVELDTSKVVDLSVVAVDSLVVLAEVDAVAVVGRAVVGSVIDAFLVVEVASSVVVIEVVDEGLDVVDDVNLIEDVTGRE